MSSTVHRNSAKRSERIDNLWTCNEPGSCTTRMHIVEGPGLVYELIFELHEDI